VRIGLISDIHGILPALDAVLAEIEHEDVDRLLCLGDLAVGP
jgi:protein phosphatase